MQADLSRFSLYMYIDLDKDPFFEPNQKVLILFLFLQNAYILGTH